MFERVEDYLDTLRQELAGADAAMIQDALADAEDHLRTGLSQTLAADPGVNERDALQRLADEYGAPAEIAAAYRQIEPHVAPPLAPAPQRRAQEPQRSAAHRFFGVFVDPRAYGALFYMLFSLISGIFYFTWATTGLSLSVGLIVLIIGLPVVALFLMSVQGIALVEGRMIEALLGVRMPRRPLFLRKDLNLWGRFKVLFTDKLSWTTIIYMILQLPLGVLYFTLLVTMFAFGLSGIAMPVLQYGFDMPTIMFNDTEWYAPAWLMPLFVIVGFLWIFLTMHLARALGRLHARYAKSLLVRD